MSNLISLTARAAKDNFFDRAVVQNAIGKETARALGRLGSFVRTTARRSIRPARRMKVSELGEAQRNYLVRNPGAFVPLKSSEPGQPPRSRTKLLRDHILFSYDSRSKSVVVGPVSLNRTSGEPVPSILEFGGQSTVKTRRGPRRVTIAPRPFMRPALEIAKPRIPKEFKNILRS
jgi:hypothetical protein